VHYRVVIAKPALNTLQKLPKDVRRRIRNRIDDLTHDPRPPGVEKLAGEPNGYRVRVGDYRVLYEIQGDQLVVYVVRIGHRRDVYRNR
jgi:mRNA interferase RelE/StbE